MKKNGKVGLSDDSGNIIIEPNYSKIESIGEDYKNGYIVQNEEGKYGIISFAKETILEPKYDEIKGVCGENAYVIKENGKYSLINKEGEKLSSKTFDDVAEINKEYVIASQGGKYGILTLSRRE